MAIPWLVALKVIPWGDVIEHAPKVLNAARKLMERQRTPQNVPAAGDSVIPMPSAEPPNAAALHQRLLAVQQQLDQQAQSQDQLTQTLAELAEQNARLVGAVEVLRVRTRLMLWGMALLALALAWSVWR
ncbi:hypothetical protein ACVC7V_21205 [Hydrogenophaga sp. A37]|uniref:hypothetical protein n=1 Tax=Hydrogenophaga sp. A37 TaxID=1945864 RepID=UPI0009850279|nr:hypothetical protein [Hydrogenophaga sp. A37]OOG81561.1 hypothetical protein B0E41_17545 [Hydrogenophaga sp. A37]